MGKASIAVIGGTGQEALLNLPEIIRIGTPYGLPSPILVGEIGGRTVAFLPRHGFLHQTAPHRVNYRANIYALRHIGVERIVATNAVGAINPTLKPGGLVVPHDLVDFTKHRKSTFYDDAPVTHIDVSQPYCPEIRSSLIGSARKLGIKIRGKAVFVCTEGPRLETPAEIHAFAQMGCDVVGMTAMPEATLARELEMCYATICLVTNMAAGLQDRLTSDELMTVAKERAPIVQQILRETVMHLAQKRRCQCAKALEHARFRG